jgi:hypothetical protein
MKVETIYKNFMGVGGPKDYGLTRRMVQLYLLCLAHQGKVKIRISAKSGLNQPAIDYSNMAAIDFSAKVLDAFAGLQKVAVPENWEVLRPYAEKLLRESISSTHDDAIIAGYRTKLRSLFGSKQEETRKVGTKCERLFGILGIDNPYRKELQQVTGLFSADLSSGNDIGLVLYALKEAFAYEAFDKTEASQTEVDDLANRLKNYDDLVCFTGYETELAAAVAYCKVKVPDLPDFKDFMDSQKLLAGKMGNVQGYIDSEVRLKTELIGSSPPVAGETGTLGAVVHEYAQYYVSAHDSVVEEVGKTHREITRLLNGDDLKALKIIEGITALQPPGSPQLETTLRELSGGLFECESPSRASIQDELKRNPTHPCGLSLANAQGHIQQAQKTKDRAYGLLLKVMDQKAKVFFNPSIRGRLNQGLSEPVIAGLMKCEKLSELRRYLTDQALQRPECVGVINRYLKEIVVAKVSLAGFKPVPNVVEKEQIQNVVAQFQKYLEDRAEEVGKDEDALLLLELE